MMTPQAFAALIAALPAGSRTMGDLMHHLDETAHAAENGGDWWQAANIRQTQADVLRFVQAGIDGRALDPDAALDATRAKEEADPAIAHCVDCGRSLTGLDASRRFRDKAETVGPICLDCADRRMAAIRDDCQVERFDPAAHPWPQGVVRWREDEPRPRDMSWGWIDTQEGRKHVMAGDLIVTVIATGEKYLRHNSARPLADLRDRSIPEPFADVRAVREQLKTKGV